jgi:hypothetical protein
MELRVDHQRVSGICQVIFRPVFTQTERDRLRRFSSPEVETGGTFTSGEISFTLPTLSKALTSFPFTASFDGIALGHAIAASYAGIYETEMVDRIQDSWDEFTDLADTFQGETVHMIT